MCIRDSTYTQLMAIITQGSLKKLREKMFSHMPVSYTHLDVYKRQILRCPL